MAKTKRESQLKREILARERAIQAAEPVDGFPEAPADGKIYGRKDLGWVEVITGGSFSGDMDDIPDGAIYVKTENNFTDTLLTKLNNIADGAEVNVQSDWNQADTGADDYIKNKPTIASPDWISIFKTTDEDRALTTTYTNDSELFTGTLLAGTYIIRGFFCGYSSSTEDIKLQLNYSGTATYSLLQNLYSTGGGTSLSNAASTAVPFNRVMNGGNGRWTFWYEQLLIVSDSGVYSLQWAQNVSGGNLTRVNAGSYFEYKKVA